MKFLFVPICMALLVGVSGCEGDTQSSESDTVGVSNGALVAQCSADFTGDDEVGMADLVRLLAIWGPCPDCPEDLSGDETVGMADLTSLLGQWGDCPMPPAADCGDGIFDASTEECDDGEVFNGNGCSSTCQIEAGWSCSQDGTISVCRPNNGTTYYIDIESRGGQCNDGYPGTNPAQPWCHLSAAQYQLSPGDLVLVRGGIYRQQLLPQNSGSPGQFVIYKGYPGDERPVIEEAGPWSSVYLNFISYIRIDGFEIRYGTGNGITGNAGGQYRQIVNNYIHYNHDDGMIICGSLHAEGNIIAGHNLSGGGHNDGIQFHCPDGHPGGQVVTIRNNIMYDNGQEFFITHPISDYLEISGNLIFKYQEDPGAMGTKGIVFYGGATETVIFGNTVYGSMNGLLAGSGGNTKVYNNIFYDTMVKVNNPAVTEFNYNLFYKSPNWPHSNSWQINIPGVIEFAAASQLLNTSYGQDNYYGNPLFENLANFDFHLSAASPAIDAGAPHTMSLFGLSNDYYDLDFELRPQGNGVDVGAYEF